MEIERKFTVKDLPELSGYAYHIMEQGYLNTDPVVRVRKEDDNYYLTYKGKGIGKDLVNKLHELAGGKENIIMYACFNENALGFYEKIGMTKTDDVVVLNEIEWTSFTVK